MRISSTFGPGSALLATLLSLTGCGGGGGDGKTTPSAVVIDGSSTVFRISNVAMEEYSKVNPEVNVVINKSGTGGGFGKYLQGEVDIVDASRAAKPEEEAKAKAQGIEWTRFKVGYDGITVVVNHENAAISVMDVGQLKAIWAPGSTVKSWKDVDPSWPDRPIVLYCPDHDSGTFEFFTEAIVGKARSQREDVQASSDDNILVKGVAGDKDGLGYFGYAYYAANKDKLNAIAIKAKPDAEPVSASPDTILDGSYRPLSRPLYIYVKNSALRRPEVAAFVKFYLEKVATLAEKADYAPPTAEDQAANLKAFADKSVAGGNAGAGEAAK